MTIKAQSQKQYPSNRLRLGRPTLRRMKVVHVIDDLGLGGAQRQLMELVKALPRRHYEIHVVSLSISKRAYARVIREAGVSLTLIEQSGTWSWHAYRLLARTIQKIQPDLVQTWLFTADLYGRLAAWRAKVPVIVSSVRSVELDKPWHYVLVDRLLRRVTDAFIVNARANGVMLIQREHVQPSKIHTIYNGVDLSTLDPAATDGLVRHRIKVDPQVPLIGTVGRLAPVKDHATFLRASALVLRQMPHAHFLIVGSGPLEGQLKRLMHLLDIESHVHILASQSHVAEVFAALDVVVVTSRYEGCSNVILEGMAMGKPVVATAVGGNPELVMSGKTGILVPPMDPTTLADAIVQLLRDPHRAQMMGQQGRKRVEAHFSLKRMVEETDALYQRLMTAVRR